MRTFDTTIQANLDNGTVDIRGLLEFEFGGGTVRFVRDIVPRVWNGNTYLPGGVFSVSDIPGKIGYTASSFSVRFGVSSDDALTPDVLEQIYSYDYRDRPVNIYDCYLNLTTGEVIDAELIRRGRIDRLSYKRSPSEGTYIEAQCYSRAIDFGRRNGLLATDANLRRRSAGDLFREHSAIAGQVALYWGRERP